MSTCRTCFGSGNIKATKEQASKALDETISAMSEGYDKHPGALGPTDFAFWSSGGSKLVCPKCNGVGASVDFETALKNYKDLPCDETYFWLEWFAKTTDQAKKVYDLTSSGSSREKAAFSNWLHRCNSISELKKIFQVAKKGSDMEERVLRSWLSLCKTATQAEEVYNKTPSGSFIETDTIHKWISLCKTVSEARRAYNKTENGSNQEEYAKRTIEKLGG